MFVFWILGMGSDINTVQSLALLASLQLLKALLLATHSAIITNLVVGIIKLHTHAHYTRLLANVYYSQGLVFLVALPIQVVSFWTFFARPT